MSSCLNKEKVNKGAWIESVGIMVYNEIFWSDNATLRTGDLSNTSKAVRERVTGISGANTAGRGTGGDREPKRERLPGVGGTAGARELCGEPARSCCNLLSTLAPHHPSSTPSRGLARAQRTHKSQPRGAAIFDLRLGTEAPWVPASRFRRLRGVLPCCPGARVEVTVTGPCGGKGLVWLEGGLVSTRGPCGADTAEDGRARHRLPAPEDPAFPEKEAGAGAARKRWTWGLACRTLQTTIGFRLFLETSRSHSVLSREVTQTT